MSDITDRIAEAICNAHDYRDHWHQLQEAERNEYRKMAAAVVAELGLTQQWNYYPKDRDLDLYDIRGSFDSREEMIEGYYVGDGDGVLSRYVTEWTPDE